MSYTNGKKQDNPMGRSSHGAMANSVFRFNDVSFVVGKGDKRKQILDNISGKVKGGRKCKIK